MYVDDWVFKDFFFGFKQCRLSVESFLKYFKHCLTVSVVKG